MMIANNVEIGRGAVRSALTIGQDHPLALIAGPCVLESREHSLYLAEKIKAIALRLSVPYVFKASYDKANRTSIAGFRGLGIDEGLRVLEDVRNEVGVPVITDVHSESEAHTAGAVVDILQIPAFLCRQTSLLIAAGNTNKPVQIKKGQFLHPSDMSYAVEKVKTTGNERVLLCERGSCFGYRDLVVDFRSLALMREIGQPVVFDGTHSVQVMGGAGGASSGNRQFIPLLLRAAAAAGVDAFFLECHEEPSRAPSDGPNMVRLDELEGLLRMVQKIDALIRTAGKE